MIEGWERRVGGKIKVTKLGIEKWRNETNGIGRGLWGSEKLGKVGIDKRVRL